MAPAPIAITQNTRPSSLSKPIWFNSGATIAEVVTNATVVEPCAVFSAAETINGIKIPSPKADNVEPR